MEKKLNESQEEKKNSFPSSHLQNNKNHKSWLIDRSNNGSMDGSHLILPLYFNKYLNDKQNTASREGDCLKFTNQFGQKNKIYEN